MIETNYYQMLGIRRNASSAEIRQAYVRLVKHIHPDIADPDLAPHALLGDLQHAYRCLLDPQARLLHDTALQQRNDAHIARLKRVQRRLRTRSRRNRDHGVSAGRGYGPRTRHRTLLLMGLIALGLLTLFEMRHGGLTF